ncbi:MAG TPA: response regulator transcription factor, partial [Ktedonobacterales bacterium]
RVLVIDDEPEIGRALRVGLTAAGFRVEVAPTAAEGKRQVAEWHPDVVVLDLTLPDADGLEVGRELRAWSRVPIIVLSVREGEADKVTALEHGADDYLTKPFSIAELIARIRVTLRHAAQGAGASGEAVFTSGALMIDFTRREVKVNDKLVHLTPTEYALLKYLAQHAGKVVTHGSILRALWGPGYQGEAHYLRVYINQLRQKIEADPSRPALIVTEPGVGYRLRERES